MEAARSMVCLHGTDPVTVYLSAWVRVDGMTVTDLERALYVDRSLVKHLAMRRTLFVFPRETVAFAQAGASNRVADTERRRLIRDVGTAGLHRNAECWLSEAWEQVLAVLSDGREATSSELREQIPLLKGSIAYGEGKSWGGQVPVGPRVLTTLSAAGHIVRASNDGGWTASRPRWASMKSWLGEEIAPHPEAEGVARLVEQWLRVFGPGTVADIKWWLGSTVAAVRRALAGLHAVEVDIDGQTGYLLPDDLEAIDPVEPWAALLRRWIRPRWAGSSGIGTSARTRSSCSTPAATLDPPFGGTGGSWAAGARAIPARSSCRCSRTSAWKGCAPWSTRRRASASGSLARGCCRGSLHRCRRLLRVRASDARAAPVSHRCSGGAR